MKILLIAYYFPPRNTVASHRLHSFAYYWHTAGHEITVLAPGPVVRDSSLALPSNGFSIHRVNRSKLHQKVLGFGSGTSNTIPERKPGISSRLKALISRFTVSRGVFRELRMPSFADLWYRPAVRHIRNMKKSWDLVVSSSHPYVTHKIARRIKLDGLAARWAADFRDPWTASTLYPGLPGFRSIESLREREVFRSADAVTTVGQILADEWDSRFGRKPSVVFNGYSDLDHPAGDVLPPLKNSALRIAYTGALYPGKRDPRQILRVLNKLGTQKQGFNDISLVFAGGHGGILLDQIAEYGLENTVEYLGNLSHGQAVQLQNASDALLFIESGDYADRGNITGKIFEYIKTGKPIIAMGIREDSEVWQILRSREGAFRITDDGSLEKALAFLLNNRGEADGKSGSDDTFSRRAQAARFLEAVSG